jgi:dTMP kinase
MSTAKRKQIDTLLDVRGRAAEQARAAVAKAKREADLATRTHEEAERTWMSTALKEAEAKHRTMDDLMLGRARLEGLRKLADVARARALEARKIEEMKNGEASHAERELRKIELWRDKADEAIRIEEARLERIQTDAFAARAFDRGRA